MSKLIPELQLATEARVIYNDAQYRFEFWVDGLCIAHLDRGQIHGRTDDEQREIYSLWLNTILHTRVS
jgi:hypothetical protein